MTTCEICGAVYNELINEECPNAINHEGLEAGAKNYKAMKKDELIAACEEKEIDLTGEESKAELIELLES